MRGRGLKSQTIKTRKWVSAKFRRWPNGIQIKEDIDKASDVMAMAKRIIISGGGTGGHIFPAIAIAHALKRLAPDTVLLFVGANGKMEMEKVPAAGYEIVGLDIQGINRSSLWKNLALAFKLYKSIRKARRIIHDFQPDVAVGVGGYASGPLLHAAARMDVPSLIQEQNSYAGITNKRLAAKADKVCVAFENMERYRSEEHTSELQSLMRNSYAVFGLKKQKKKNND